MLVTFLITFFIFVNVLNFVNILALDNEIAVLSDLISDVSQSKQLNFNSLFL